MTYFFRLFKLIETNDRESHLIVHSLLSTHVFECFEEDHKCGCQEILKKIDDIKQQEKMLMKLKDEMSSATGTS